jgi:hypothetical protein
MRVPFVSPIGARDAASITKDGAMINCYAETTEAGEHFVTDRPGVELYQYGDLPAGVARGLYLWNYSVGGAIGGQVVSVVGTTIYSGTTALGVAGGTTEPYHFAECGIGNKFLFFHDRTNSYYLDTSGALTTNTDTDFTNFAPYASGVVCVDSYVFALTRETGQINNSNLLTGTVTPNTWNALDYITAEAEPDIGIHITRHLSYVVAMKRRSIEFFYDAANATGSPLARVDGARKAYGCAHGRTVARIGDILFWVGRTGSGSGTGRFIAKLESMQEELISTKAIDKIIAHADLDQAYACAFRVGGQTFYMLTLVGSNLTLLYDVKEGMWHRWTDASGNYWPYVFAACNTSDDTYFQHLTSGNIVRLVPGLYTDEGAGYTATVRSGRFDFGARGWKVLTDLEVTAEPKTGSLSVSYSDDDYATLSSPRTYNMTGRIWGRNWGKLQRRSFQFSHPANGARLQAVDFEVTPIA